ncbi:MAG: adenylate/guanylate cyclase domain-containing protein, partial [Mycobacteriaceae bacterium]
MSTSTFADYSDEDLGLAHLLVGYRDLGLNENGLLASARILGRNVWAVADSVESILQERLAAAREHPEVALRYADEFRRLAEIQAQILAHVVS